LLKAFVIDTTDGLEVDQALRSGFEEGNLHVCNVNPAIVATLKRRHPGITTYGVDADAALRRAHKQGERFDVISLDLCGPISERTLDTLDAARAVVNGQGRVGLTIMRGREPDGITVDIPGGKPESWRRLIRRVMPKQTARACLKKPKDYMRIAGPMFRLQVGDCHWASRPDSTFRAWVTTDTPRDEWCGVSIVAGGIYPSGSITMLWCVYNVVQPVKWQNSRGRPAHNVAHKRQARAPKQTIPHHAFDAILRL
jgi:hypothetical protein